MATHETEAAETATAALGVTKSGPKGALTNAGWNGFFTLWSIAISFLLTPLLIHHLGTAQYGILLLIWSITGILGIANFGLGEATLRYVAYYYGNRDLSGVNRVFGATLSFYVVICLVISIAMLGAAPGIASLLKIPAEDHLLVYRLLRLSALVFSLGIISRAFGAIPMALHRYDIASKVNIAQNVIRSVGYVLLVVSKFGILSLVLWDAVTNLMTICVQAVVIRRLSPEVKLAPSFSFGGLQEVFGYSIFSLLTYIFYTMFRESGKLLLGRYLGPAPVAYVGTPDNVAQRVHMVIASSSETLLPRFSANRDPKVAESLFLSATWAALAASIIFFIPLVVLMPDFLSLWINPEFARQSAKVGQWIALSYITQGAFAPAATFFRGSGKPWFVSVVIFLAGIGTLVAGLILIPIVGTAGVGYAYFFGSMAHLLGLLYGWFYMFGASSIVSLMRFVGFPLLWGGIAFALESAVRSMFPELTWLKLFMLGGLFAGLTALFVLGADWILGGDSPSKVFWDRISKSSKLDPLFRYFRVRRAI